MKKTILLLTTLSISSLLTAQIGVNTEDPKASLHVVPLNTGGSTAEGIIGPNLTRSQLIGKDARYTTAQKGAIVYVTDLSGTLTAKTTNVKSIGYYFFDGAIWQQFGGEIPSISIPSEPWQVQGGTTAATGNAQNIYQTGSVGIGASTAVPAAYKFQVTGNTNTTGNQSVTGTSTLTGNVGVGRIPASTYKLAVDGGAYVTGDHYVDKGLLTTVSTGTAAAPVAAIRIVDGNQAAGKVLISDASGKGTWTTLPVTATTEPWQVQGGTTAATTNAQNIYQTGSVAIGSNTAGTYKFQVTGDVNLAGTTRQTGNMFVTNRLAIGTTTLQNQKLHVESGGTAAAPVAAIRIIDGNQAAGKVLTSDANGVGSWSTLPAATVTTANNGLTMSGTTAQLGGALTKATTVTGSATNTLTLSAPVTIPTTGSFTLGGNGAAAGKYLASDASGKGTWTTLPVTATTEPWQVQGGTTAATTNAQNIFQTGSVAIGSNTAGIYKLKVTGSTSLEGHQFVTGQTKVGGTAGSINASAQLELADNNKGLLPNRVALTAANVKAPVTNAVDGMLVYNTASVPAEGLQPGYYFWRNNSWTVLLDKPPINSSRILNLTSNVSSAACTSTNGGNTATAIPFNNTIVANEDGSYAFQLRLYGSVKVINAANVFNGRTIFFFFVYRVRNGVSTIIDAAEVNFYLQGSLSDGTTIGQTYTLMLNAPDCQAGDRLEIKFGDYFGGNIANRKAQYDLISSPSQSQAARTSMVFWKL